MRAMNFKHPLASLLAAIAVVAFAPDLRASPSSPELIIHNGNVWTLDPDRPTAQAVSIAEGRILAVGSSSELLASSGPATKTIDARGGMVLPGFVDSHTHFGNAIDAFYTARVIDIDDVATLYERLREAAQRVPSGMWITGADMSGLVASKAAKRGDRSWALPMPSLAALDAAIPDHPVMIRFYDGRAFVNSYALKLAKLDSTIPDPPYGAYGRDSKTGALTGLLTGNAVQKLATMLPPASKRKNLVAGRAVVQALNAQGITGIHDIARIESISRQQQFQVHVERSYTDMTVFEDLREAGALTVRVHALLSLAGWRDYARIGITPGAGDDLIRYGALKAFMDFALMREPYLNAPGRRGSLAYRVTNADALRADMIGADRLGFDLAVHVVGDAGLDLLLDNYQAALQANPSRERRFRLIHMWYTAPDQMARASSLDRNKQLKLFVDITPSHLTDQLGTIDAALGPQRAPTAFPWRSAADAGLILDIGSDWPGSFDGTTVQPNNPLENIAAAISRGVPDGGHAGWHPEQAISVDEAIRAYTINPARAAREEHSKGSVTQGKLADLVVLEQDIRRLPPKEVARTKVLYTLLGGRVVYAAAPGPDQ